MSERRSEGDLGFTRVAIVNRGEAAVRLLRAVRELNLEHACGIRTIALHTVAERRAMFVREADETVLIAPERAYLDHGELERALRASDADAAWVGWGFVAENPAFAEMRAAIGVAFIGPPSEVMRRLGDRNAVRLLAEELGVPVAAWSGGPVASLDAAVEGRISGARRVEVQIIADDHGAVWAARARLLDPAQQPEADRGVGLAGAGPRAGA